MAKTRPEKKSETLEVRLPHSKKEAFKAACEAEGITASHAIRTFIDAYLKQSRRAKLKQIAEDITMKLMRHKLKTAGIFGAGLAGAVLLAASPSVADTDAFTLLDKNSDGVLTVEDIQSASGEMLTSLSDVDANGDGKITRSEFENVKMVSLKLKEGSVIDGKPASSLIMIPADGEVIDEAVLGEDFHWETEDGKTLNLKLETDTPPEE